MSGNKIDFFKNRILKNREDFLAKEDAIIREKNFNEKCELAYEAALFATTHTTDIFSSPIIENVFLELAQQYSIDLPTKYSKGTMLHVMTEAYTSGGHTRCVERFAQQLKEFRHSCVILNQYSHIPSQLEVIMKQSGGEVLLYDVKSTMLDKALNLRQFASSFEYIVLHIHMHDPIALIAFGVKEFQRPIIFFNHADHTFWLGVSISDYVSDLNNYGNSISKKYRGCKYLSVLRIPQDNSELLKLNKDDARKKIGLPLNKKIIYSGGQAKKYAPISDISFFNIVSDIIDCDDDVLFYIAGVCRDDIFWPELKKKYPKNLFLLGKLDYTKEYPYYLASADLVIDSFPVGGGTAVIDAVKAGKPVLTLIDKVQSDFLIESKGCCHSYQELLKKTHKILNSSKYAKEIYHDIYKRFTAEVDTKIWHKKFEEILKSLPEKHQIYKFKRKIPKAITSSSLETTRWTEDLIDEQVSLKKILKKIRKFIFQINLGKKKKIIRILGVYLLRKGNVINGKNSRNNIF